MLQRFCMTNAWMLWVCGLAVAGQGTACSADDPGVMLAAAGRSAYRIVISAEAPVATRYAAEELQRFLTKMTGARLPIATDAAPPQDHEILVGKSQRLSVLHTPLDLAGLGKEGYILRTVGTRLLIVGGMPRGTLYGVYGFLEDHGGCRWFTPEVERIPQVAQLPLPALNERRAPLFEYRETYLWDSFNGDWMARNRLNGDGGRGRLADRWKTYSPAPHLDAKHGGGIHFGSGYFVHTLGDIVPAARYLKSHPEYFALCKGKRSTRQVCCTNPDVVRICTAAIRDAMRRQPDATVFSLSQNDTNAGFCECPRCQALAQAEQCQVAPLLQLVNSVAAGVEKEFPDKIVETLAYRWSRQAPRTMQARPNVVIRLCNIECCFAHPLAEGCTPENKAFCHDLQAWAKVCGRLWIWDYDTDFAHYLLPLPRRRVLPENLRFFAENHVAGVFLQSTYETPDGDLEPLDAYWMAKLLWNPYCDANAVMNEFLQAYYGPAGPTIRQYLDLLHKQVAQNPIHVGTYAAPTHSHLPPALLTAANALWDQAEACVAQNAVLLDRVRRSRMSVDYAIVERARVVAKKVKGQHTAEQQALLALARQRFAPFMETMAGSQLQRLCERKPFDKAEYRRGLAADLEMIDEQR